MFLHCQQLIIHKILSPITTSVNGIYIVNSSHIVNGTLNVNETIQLAEKALKEILNRKNGEVQKQS